MSLDPDDPTSFRAQAHAALDRMLDGIERGVSGPVWRPMPDEVRRTFDAPLPLAGRAFSDVTADFEARVAPFTAGNRHPRFFGWVHGGGTAVGALAEMLAAGLDANVGGRDHAPVEIERQVVRWMRALFRFPDDASGIVVSGTSMANFMAVIVAKTKRLGAETRKTGLGGSRLVAYTSTAAHNCVERAFELCGLGADALRRIATDASQRIDRVALEAAILRDRAAGLIPFMLIGTAGTVDTGAIDDLQSLADLASREQLWFHVDGAFGALAVLSPELAPKVAGLERADSVAFDFHKWMQVPYDAAFLLVRDGVAHRAAFASEAQYLARATRGLAAGTPWFTDFGPELSRGFRALKVWFTLMTFGVDMLGEVVAETCRLARVLADRVRREPALELACEPQLNIVCFRHRHADSAELVIRLQESGLAVPSSTRIDGVPVIRAAIVNHRTTENDIHALVDAVLKLAE
ncbi:MAG: aspartate aminotransferase family protein [Myxococcales bacterium]|nr:aspartate aminotransferase family protein [Myxococcales bacterium]